MEQDTGREYSIGELADEAGISTRTIRYYVSEGLLPPPAGAGPGSRYSDAHLEQLAIISRLKEQYLPLKEIRRRLIGHNLPTERAEPQADALQSPPGPERAGRLHNRLFSKLHMVAEEQSPLEHPGLIMSEAAFSLPPPDPVSVPWRRIVIADGVELLLTEHQYTQHRDKIDWLVQWAGRVLD